MRNFVPIYQKFKLKPNSANQHTGQSKSIFKTLQQSKPINPQKPTFLIENQSIKSKHANVKVKPIEFKF